MKKRITNLENIIIQQNNKIRKLEEKMKQIEPLLEEYNRKKEKEKLFFSNSDILDKEDKELLINWLPKKPKTISLLMNSNIDGDTTEAFFNKCQNKCPTLSIIKTTNGYKFGGYTSSFWKEGKVADSNAFVFSLDKKKKYGIKNPDTAICYNKNMYWMFGCFSNAIVVYDKCTSNNNNYVGNGTYNITEQYELNGGQQHFTVSSFEIYYIN